MHKYDFVIVQYVKKKTVNGLCSDAHHMIYKKRNIFSKLNLFLLSQIHKPANRLRATNHQISANL